MASHTRRALKIMAHRGNAPGNVPENTLAAFEGAIAAGASLIETDLHLSQDNVAMLCHSVDLKEAFGVPRKLVDCEYSYLKTLRTLQAPHEEMPSFKECLQLLRQPRNQHVGLVLDIKTYHKNYNADHMMSIIAETIREVDSGVEKWHERLHVGCWEIESYDLCRKYLPGFPIIHIGYMIPYARQFLGLPNVSFSLHYAYLVGNAGQKFLEDARRQNREVYSWTVDKDEWIRWAVCEPNLTGICTGEFERIPPMVESCSNVPGRLPLSFKMRLEVVGWRVFGWIYFHMKNGINWTPLHIQQDESL